MHSIGENITNKGPSPSVPTHLVFLKSGHKSTSNTKEILHDYVTGSVKQDIIA